MRIKVGDVWYDGRDVPVMVELSKSDKENLGNMLPNATKYCDYPDRYSFDEIRKFMEVDVVLH